MRFGGWRAWITAWLVAVSPLLAMAWQTGSRGALARTDIAQTTGRRPWARQLVDMGFQASDFPAAGLFPPPAPSRDSAEPATDPAERFALIAAMDRETRWKPMVALVESLPDVPGAQAALCRFACLQGGSLRIGREDEITPGASLRPMPPTSAPDIAVVLAAAARGARIEPRNAVFPTMSAVACLAGRRDGQARRHLRQAAACTEWNEHLDWELEGALRLSAKRVGQGPALMDGVRQMALLYPHYAAVRSAARLLAAQAFRQEQAGGVADATSVRTDVAIVGGLLRTQGPTLIANLVGCAIESIAASVPPSRPLPFREPGAGNGQGIRSKQPPPKPGMGSPSGGSVIDAERTTRIANALRSRARDTEWARWRSAPKARQEIRALVDRGMDNGPLGVPAVFDSIASSAVRWALLAASGHCLMWAISGMAFGWAAPRTGRRAAAALALAAGVIGSLMLLHTMGSGARDLLATAGMWQGLAGGDSNAAPSDAIMQGLETYGTWMSLAVWLPVLSVTAAATVAIARRQPFHRTSAIVLPIGALVASLLWTVRVVRDARIDRETRIALRECLRAEGAWLAGQMGKEWTGQ